jgi:hypothetical protein
MLKAFHNDPAIKAKYLSRVDDHAAADRLIRGVGWSDDGDGIFKGCAVGCTLEAYDHSRYPVELGIPEWLARVEDTLFEGMTLERSRTWPHDFLAVINVGADLSKAEAPFVLACLNSTLASLNSVTLEAVDQDIVKLIQEATAAVSSAIELWSRSDHYSLEWEADRAALADLAALAARAARAALADLAARAALAGLAALADLAARAALAGLADLAARAALAGLAGLADLADLAAPYYWRGDPATYDLFAKQLLEILSAIPAEAIEEPV